MRKSNFALRLQPSLLDDARRTAEEEGVALNQLINVAVAEKVSAIRAEAFFRERARRANISEALDVFVCHCPAAGTTSGLAQDGGSTAQSAAPKVDFVYRLGRTTLEEARAYWAQNGMKIVGAGHLALGGGSGMDGAARVSAEKVLLVDVSGIDFEGISNARFGF